MKTKPPEVTEKEKFELEFVTTAELCHIAIKCKEDIVHLAEKIRLYGSGHEQFQSWITAKHLKEQRREYVLLRIKARQKTLL